MIPEPPLMQNIPPGERFSSERLVNELKEKGLNASYFPNTDLLLDELEHAVFFPQFFQNA